MRPIAHPPTHSSRIARVRDRLGLPTVLVNLIAAPMVKGPSSTYDAGVFARMVEVNVLSHFVMSQAVWRPMQEARRGAIVNFASISGIVGHREAAAYAASKGGVIQITRTLAVEWAPMIRVNAVAPSWFETGGLMDVVQGRAERGINAEADDYLARQLARVTVGRMGKPDEIVGPVMFPASDAAAMVTGHILMVDGGLTAL